MRLARECGESGTVVVVGSANLDIVVDVQRVPSLGETVLGDAVTYLPGGKGLNQACASASYGTDTFFVGTVGEDDAGRTLRRSLEDVGVHVDFLRVSEDFATGTAHILVTPQGANQIVVVPSANGHVSTQSAMHALEEVEVSCVVLQGEIPIDTCLRAAEAASSMGKRVIFNCAPATRDATPIVRLADPLVVNEFEAAILTGLPAPQTPEAAMEHLAVLLTEAHSAVITLGKLGLVWGDQREAGEVPEYPVPDVVDTTGAGDAFVGVLAAALASGSELKPAIEEANRMAALSVTLPGASASYSAIRDAKKLMPTTV